MLYDTHMDINQIGMILEIAGFLLVAFFAGILLERGVLGVWNGKVESLCSSVGTALDKFTFSWSRTGWYSLEFGVAPPGGEKLSSLRLGTFASILICSIESTIPLGSIVCTIIGWLQDIPWLFWMGVSIFCLAFVSHMVMWWREEGPFELGTDILLLPVGALVNMLVFSSITLLVVPLCFSLGILRALQIVVMLLAGKDSLKKAFIIVGSLMVLSGLILEFVSTI